MAESLPQLSITQCVTLRLTSKNYLLWKTQFESFFSGQKLLGFITGTERRPPLVITVETEDGNAQAENPEYDKWFRSDQMVRAWLLGSLSEDILGEVYHLPTSNEVWLALATHFNRVSASRLFELQRKLQNHTKQTKTMTEYLREYKAICDTLSSIGHPVTDHSKIFGVLNGLGKEYEAITTVLENSMNRHPAPSYEDVMSQLSGFDDKLQAYDNSSQSINPHLAFVTQDYPNYSNQDGGRGYSNQGRGSPYTRGYRGRGAYSTRGRGFHQQIQSNSSNSEEQAPRVCQICGRNGHTAIQCWKRFDHSYQTEISHSALTAQKVPDEGNYNGSEWYPDTGASTHVTNSEHNLKASQPYTGHDSVMVGNGDFLPITHVGSIPLSTMSCTLSLEDVLVCPGITKNLLSVSKLTYDYPCKFVFDCDRVKIKDKKTRQLLTQGRRSNGLYQLENPQFMAFYSTRQQVASEDTWHRKLGHPSKQILQVLSKRKSISINKNSSTMCGSCQLGKSSKLPFLSSDYVASRPLERIHCDLWGPSPCLSVQGFKYYVVFIDNYSRFSWLYPLRLKSDFFAIFKTFQQLVENTLNQRISMFQCDGGGEFSSKLFLTHLAQCGIRQLISCPHTPQQNGIAEKKHRHLTELSLAMMFESKVPHKYWVEAFFTANFLSNLLPTSVSSTFISPYETLFGKQPVYTSLRTFGCACYPSLRPYTQNKFDPRSLQCVFLGYNEKYKGYRCIYPPTGRVYISRHVLFDEMQFPFSKEYSHLCPEPTTPLLSAWKLSQPSATVVEEPLYAAIEEPLLTTKPPSAVVQAGPATAPSPVNTDQPHSPAVSEDVLHTETDSESPLPESPQPETTTIFTPEDFPPLPESPQPALAQNEHPMTTRSKVGVIKPNPKYALSLVHHNIPAVPKSVASALKHEGWNKAMNEEINTVKETHTWDLVPATSDMNILGCKWVFRTKLHADGSLDKLKARLVAKGFLQEEGVDYVDTYSPVVKTGIVRLVLHTATIMKWDIRQLDVKNAFLHGDLEETVFMQQPPGFKDKEHPDYVCCLRKALYGLKQAPRAWFDKFTNYLLEYGFFCSKSDPSLFICHKGSDVIILLLYVDDIVLTGNNNKLLQSFIANLSSEFKMKDLGRLHYFLGIQVQFNNNGMFLSQQKYTEDLLRDAGMTDCALVLTPLPLQLDKVQNQTESFVEPTYFRSLAGKLQYLTLTRPNIQFAVNYVCQKMHTPSVSDFTLLKRILRYLKGTLHMGINFNSDTDSTLRAYSDSDWAGCKETRRSTGGFCTFLGSNIISWSARKQPTVSRSSTEAEYRSLSDTAAEMKWITNVMKDIGLPQPQVPELYCDNMSAIYLSATPALHKRSKHFDTDFHFVRERVALRALVVKHVPASLQLADIFTKSLAITPFTSLRFKLGVQAFPNTSLRGGYKHYKRKSS